MSQQQSRRDFIRAAALTGAGVWMADKSWAVSSPQHRIIGANDRIKFACIGVGGKGGEDSTIASRFGDIIAICDVDDNTLNSCANRDVDGKTPFTSAKKYNDYRKMYEEMGKDIDAVTVTTPDHHHVHAASMAIMRDIHCFCQKPLTHSIYEARYLGDLARKHKVATQMGNQGTAEDSLRANAYKVRAGALGTVSEVHVWTNRPIWPQGTPRPAPEPVPDNLHWDLWLGPAPDRPYVRGSSNKAGYHSFAWRGWWDFGTGALGDMACHTVNLPYMALDLRWPTSVEATSSGTNKDSYPTSSKIVFQFPAIKTAKYSRPALTMYWYDGHNLPPVEKVVGDPFPAADLVDNNKLTDSGSLIIGDKGKLYTPRDYGTRGVIVAGVKVEAPYPKSPGHFEEFVRAIRTNNAEPAMSNFPDYSGPLTETILLGNLAVWAAGTSGEKGRIEWDAKKLHAKNASSDINDIIRPRYRSGYSI